MIHLFWLLPSFFILLIASVNLLTWQRPKLKSGCRVSPETKGEEFTVLIPARNEAHNLPRLLASLEQQPYLKRIIICDDDSSDGTAELLRSWSQRLPHLQWFSARSLPSGWIGKPWACQQLFEKTSPEDRHLLYLDADVELEPQATEALQALEQTDTRLTGFVPRQRVESWSEKLMMPFLYWTYLCWLPLNWGNAQNSPRFVAANGQAVLTSHRALRAVDGFQRVATEVVDDVALAKVFRQAGLNSRLLDGAELFNCRMYRNLSEIWQGFSKNIAEGLGSAGLLGLMCCLYALVFMAPLGLALWALNIEATHLKAVSLSLLAAWLCASFLMARRFRLPLWGVILFPIGAGFVISLALNSARWTSSDKIKWAGRSYQQKAKRKVRANLPPFSKKNARFTKIFAYLAQRDLAKHFAGLHCLGIEQAQEHLKNEPLILASNHIAYWDTLLMLVLETKLGARAHAYMDAQNLNKVPFFRWVGVIDLDRTKPQQAHRDLLAGARYAQLPGDLLILFPSGQQQPSHAPLNFQPGAAALSRKAQARTLPVAIRYEYLEHSAPEIFVAFGPPLAPPSTKANGGERAEYIEALEQAVAAQLDRIDRYLEEKRTSAISGEKPQLLFHRPLERKAGLGEKILSYLAR